MTPRFHDLSIIVLVLVNAILVVSGSKKLSLNEYDEKEIAKIKEYNQTRLRYGLEPIFYSAELMNMAQQEASRLAEFGLSRPLWLKSKGYRGFSVRISSKKGKYYCNNCHLFHFNLFLIKIKMLLLTSSYDPRWR